MKEYIEKCYYCGSTKCTGIGFIDDSKGLIPENIVSCCSKCGSERQNMTEEEFEDFWDTLIRNKKPIDNQEDIS